MQETNQTQTNDNPLLEYKNLDGGLGILVELSEKGEINPWDIDIIDLTDKYLQALNSTPRENLLNAGRAIFYASVLLRLKSEILLNISNETLSSSHDYENFFPEDEFLDDEEIKLDLSKLEGFIQRSSQGRQQRKRKIILSDLILALQQAEEEEERRALRAKLRAERIIHTIIAPEIPDDVLEMAHEEDIEDIVERIESIIQEHLTDEKPITYEFLCGLIGNKVKPFLALLFMSHAKKIVIEQKEMYGEIYLYKPDKIIDDVVDQEKVNEITKKEEEEKANKAKKRKSKGLANKVKEKIKDVAKAVKEKITGKKDNEQLTEIGQTLNMSEELISEIPKELKETNKEIQNGVENTSGGD